MIAASPWIAKYAHLFPPRGVVLDVACGAGRHSVYLREMGHHMIAVDIDTGRFEARGMHGDIALIEADLEGDGWPFRAASFAGIVVVNYLWRPLFPEIIAALKPGGVLLYDTFMQGNEKFGRPRNPDFLLAPGEFARVFGRSLEIIDAFEGDVAEPAPACRQMIAARKPHP